MNEYVLPARDVAHHACVTFGRPQRYIACNRRYPKQLEFVG